MVPWRTCTATTSSTLVDPCLDWRAGRCDQAGAEHRGAIDLRAGDGSNSCCGGKRAPQPQRCAAAPPSTRCRPRTARPSIHVQTTCSSTDDTSTMSRTRSSAEQSGRGHARGCRSAGTPRAPRRRSQASRPFPLAVLFEPVRLHTPQEALVHSGLEGQYGVDATLGAERGHASVDPAFDTGRIELREAMEAAASLRLRDGLSMSDGFPVRVGKVGVRDLFHRFLVLVLGYVRDGGNRSRDPILAVSRESASDRRLALCSGRQAQLRGLVEMRNEQTMGPRRGLDRVRPGQLAGHRGAKTRWWLVAVAVSEAAYWRRISWCGNHAALDAAARLR
jgi:hypothetical protein